ncbi:MAG: kelch repeat-containing protein [Planctomycetota bacterium]
MSSNQSALQPLPEARASHTAVLLASGEIFVAGGLDVSGNPMTTTVLVSPTAVVSGPSLSVARTNHTAVRLNNGQVLIAGGQSDAQGVDVLDSTEIFDPLAGTITSGPSLGTARAKHVAMNYFDGNKEFVLVAGGVAALNTQTQIAPAMASAEVYDVAKGTFAPVAASLTEAQSGGQIARLDNGGLLVCGGESATGPAMAQVYDPKAQSFSPAANVAARSGAAVASKGSSVLVAGGESATGIEDSTEIFDSLTSTFSAGANLGAARRDATASVAGSEIVLVGGRDVTGASDLVERVSGALSVATIKSHTALGLARYAHTATSTQADTVIVIGGFDAAGVPTASIEKVDLAAVAQASSATSTTPTPTTGSSSGMSPGAIPGGTPTGTTITTGTGTTGSTGTTTTGSGSGTATTGTSGSSGGLSGLLGSLLGGGSGSSGSSSILNVIIQSAIQALTQTTGSGSGFSGFMSAFVQNVIQNLLGGGSTSSGSSSGLAGILGSLLGGSSGSSSGSGLSGLLSSLLGGSSGSSSGAGGLSGLLGSLFGGSSSGGSSGSSSGGLSGLLSSLFGGGSSSSSGSTGSTGSTTAGSGSTGSSTALAIQSMTPNQGPVGTQVVIMGTNFGSSVVVRFNGTPAQIASATINGSGVVTVTCSCPNGATTGMVTVESGGMTANAGTYTVQ